MDEDPEMKPAAIGEDAEEGSGMDSDHSE